MQPIAEQRTTEPTTEGRSSRIAYQPALDGVRALAVMAVLLFHAGVPGFDGGYVGVSVFFTLSGFLITSLLLRERASSGGVDAPAFYARRARRLLPASALCLGGIVLLSTFGAWDQVAHLRADVIAAALQVFNWLRLTGGSSYGDLFAKTGGQVSPVEHYWSLAIEEQFYWVWPLAFIGLTRWAERRGRPMLHVLAVPAVVAVIAAPIIAVVFGPDAAYWSTFARVGEILTGTVAAAIVAERGAPRWARSAAPACLLLIAAAVIWFPSVGGPAYQGWLPALSIVTVVLLLGLQSDGHARTALSWRPLVAIGTISYGVYLFHWPIFTLVDEARLGRGGAVLLAARLGITFAVAIASYVLIERPIRLRKRAPRPTLVAGLSLTIAVLVLALLIPATGPTIDTAGEAAAVAAIDPSVPKTPLRTTGTTTPETASAEVGPPWRHLAVTAPTPLRPVRILVVGDSTAKATGGGVARWAAANPDLAQVTIAGAAGCGFVQGGVRVFPEGDQEVPPSCPGYATAEIGEKVRELQPDVVMAMVPAWDVINQRFPGTDAQAPTDPEYRRRIERDYAAVTKEILDAGAPKVVWVTEPITNPFWNPVHSPQEEPERHAVLHGTIEDLAADDPARVSVADLAWWIDEAGVATDHEFRPDGVHLSTPAAERVATEWLGPLLVRSALTN